MADQTEIKAPVREESFYDSITNYAADLLNKEVFAPNAPARQAQAVVEGAALGAVTGAAAMINGQSREKIGNAITQGILGGVEGANKVIDKLLRNSLELTDDRKVKPETPSQTEKQKGILEHLKEQKLEAMKFDKSPKFTYPQDKELDPKEAAEYAEKIGKWVKEDLMKKGELSLDVQDRLKEFLRYGISHGRGGMEEAVKLLNKQLEGTGFEVKTDGKPWAYYQSCFPNERGTYHGDFISFKIEKGGKNTDWVEVRVRDGDYRPSR